MMKHSNWSLAGYVMGLIWSLGFAIRYIFIWEDYSQAIIYISIGIFVICFSWLYDQKLKNDKDVKRIQDFLDDFNFEWRQRDLGT